MAVSPGTRLGPYEILAAVGAGGMGEVYRARDTRLDRIVAIKVLPAHLADKPELRERFEREARTIASLNHPHICTLYDIGRQDGTDFLVMEYLEGETLAHRLLKSPLPLDQVLPYAIEIADALDKAHRKGITHRDLKPGNVMLTKSGTKLLDFGLAKLKQEAAPQTPFSQLPTAAGKDAVTQEGTILGTLHYMAPEQAEGRTEEIDARTDIFAFGAVVYEMATGVKAFEGRTSASVIAKILEVDPPPIASLQPMAPPALDRVVKRCLAKDREERWQSAHDLWHELKWVGEGGSQAPMVARPRSPLNNVRIAWSVAAVLLAGLFLGALFYFRRAPADTQSLRFFVSPPGSLAAFGTTTSGTTAPLAVSPDGHRIAFVAMNTDGKYVLWVRSLDTLTAQALAGTEGASSPFWSPDSRFLGFFAGGKLKKIEASAGPPVTLCDAPNSRGGTWGQSGVIVFNPANLVALQKVSASGGAPTAATVLAPGEVAHMRPSFLSDGRHFLYRVFAGSVGGPIYVASLDSSERKLLFNADSQDVLYTQGHLLFLRENTLMAQPFDERRLAVTGDAVPIAEQVQTTGTNPPYGLFSASQNGVLAYQAGGDAAGTQLLWFDRTGKQTGVLGDPGAYGQIELSPDGKRALVSLTDQSGPARGIWIFDVARGLRTRFTFDPSDDRTAIWSPDATRVVFNSNRKGLYSLYQKAASGAGAEDVLLEDNLNDAPDSWSPDGRFILYSVVGKETSLDLFVLPLSGDRKPAPFLTTKFNEDFAEFSPDGRWVAYHSDESGRYEVYVTSFPGAGGKWQISTAGGSRPRWRRDGAEIFYLASDNKLVAAAVNGKGSSFEVGAVKPLFQTRAVGPLGSPYDVSADGQRFLINTRPEQTAAVPITVVMNWTEGLKR